MTLRTKVVLIYFTITILAAGLCWSIYRSTSEVDHAFTTFVDEDLQTLDHLFSVRANLSEHERLLYEYYATTERTPVLLRLGLLRRTLGEDLAFLRDRFVSSTHFQALERAYAGFSDELERLDAILKDPATDWDTARASLVRLSDHGREAAPALDQLFQVVSARSERTQARVGGRLEEITALVVGFVIVALALALAVGYFTRETLRTDAARRRLAYFPERNPEPIFCLTLDGEVTYVNPSCHRLAARIDENLPSILPPDIKDRIQTLLSSSKQSLCYEYELCGHVFSATLQLLPDLGLCHVYVTDVTEQRNAEKELRFLAYHDPITNLPNRHSFLDDCESWAGEQDFAFSVVTIAFLRFELVVRNLGLDAVDELLKQLGHQLSSALADADAGIHTARIYRLSGASFAVLLRAQQDTELREVTERVADLLLLEATQPFRVRRREFWLHPAIGASFCPDDTITAATLIGHASAALARLAAENRQGYQTFTPEIMGMEETWLETETALRHGLEQGEFHLYYQPKVVAADGNVCGLEALIRWDRTGHGLVSPADFIPVAEESGLILMLGYWVLNETCRQAAVWRSSGLDRFTVAVNVSALQFQQADFITHVQQALQRHGLDARYLELEITESLLMKDLERNIATLKALRELGLELLLDDFGTGYSSLEYLRRFPVTRLKIDRAFVTNIVDEPRECAIVRAMIELAHQLDMKVVAEGVETQQQAALLTRLDCDEFQGYYFCRPLAPANVLTWWLDWKNNPELSIKATA